MMKESEYDFFKKRKQNRIHWTEIRLAEIAMRMSSLYEFRFLVCKRLYKFLQNSTHYQLIDRVLSATDDFEEAKRELRISQKILSNMAVNLKHAKKILSDFEDGKFLSW